MPTAKPLAIDYSQPDSTPTFIPRSRIHSSQQAGWKNIQQKSSEGLDFVLDTPIPM